MVAPKKKSAIAKRSKKYNEKLEVKGSFMDIMKSIVKDAKNKSAKKK